MSVYDAHRQAKKQLLRYADNPSLTDEQRAVSKAMTESPTKARATFAERREIVKNQGTKTMTRDQFNADFKAVTEHGNKVAEEIKTSGLDLNATVTSKETSINGATVAAAPDVDVTRSAHNGTVRALANDTIKMKDGKPVTTNVQGIGERMKKTLEVTKDKPVADQAKSVFQTATAGIKAHARSITGGISQMGMGGSSTLLAAAAVATGYGLYKTVTSPFKGKTVDEEGNVKEPTLLKKTVNTVLSAALMVGGAVLARQAMGAAVGNNSTVAGVRSWVDKTINSSNWMGGNAFQR